MPEHVGTNPAEADGSGKRECPEPKSLERSLNQREPPQDDDTAQGLLDLLRHECTAQWRQFRSQVGRSLDGQVTGMLVRQIGRALRQAGPSPDDDAGPDFTCSRMPAQQGNKAPVAAPDASPQVDPDTSIPPVDGDAVQEDTARTSLEVAFERLGRRFAARREARAARRERLMRRRAREQELAEAPVDGTDADTAGEPADNAGRASGTAHADGTIATPDAEPATVVPAGEGDRTGDSPPALPAEDYVPPSWELLDGRETRHDADPEEIARAATVIQTTIDSFGIDAEVGEAVRGPRVTLFEIRVARGVKVEAISGIANNLAMDLAATTLRILAPVPGHDFVGIEVPNRESDVVRIGALLRGELWRTSRAQIPLPMGRNVRGEDVILDLTRAPHLLVAGATGSGKSVFLNSIMMSLLCRYGPEDLQLLLVDPKVVEFSVYMSLPHLVVPVISEVSTVVLALRWVVREMERRYRLLAKVGVRNLEAFNARPPDPEPVLDDEGNPVPAKLPYLVLIIDELADIMMTARADTETHLARIAQMSRAVGIHTIVATQRPSVNVITGVIKANYPARVAFQVSSQIDARTIMDHKGAEALLGAGDMLYKSPTGGRLQRLQGALVSDGEIEAVVREAARQGPKPEDYGVLKTGSNSAENALETGAGGDAGEDEALIQEALEIIRTDRRASTSYIQRRLRIGYNRAASIIDALEARGILGPKLGTAPREILIDDAGQHVDDTWEVDLD